MLDPDSDPTPRLKAFKGAVLILHGKASPIPASAVDDLKTAFPQASVELLEACGHWPWWDQPETFYRILGAFLGEALQK
jgi:pimeloyl-ACP methyl ester carboxylesterase